MTFRKLIISASATAFLATAAFANPMVGGAAMYANKNIIENALNSKDHTTLVAAVTAAGLVDIRAGLIIGVAAAVTAVPAVELAQILSPRHSAELFAVLLVLIAGQMTYKTIRATRDRRRAGAGPALEPGRP